MARLSERNPRPDSIEADVRVQEVPLQAEFELVPKREFALAEDLAIFRLADLCHDDLDRLRFFIEALGLGEAVSRWSATRT